VRRVPTVVLTGATRGIGAAAAVQLAARGAELALVGRDPERVREAADAARAAVNGAAVHEHVADLASMAEVRRLAGELKAAHARTKLCNVLFTRERQRRHPELAANCFHPGLIRTGFGKNDGLLARIALTSIGPFLRSPDHGARPLVHLALDPAAASLHGQYLEKGRPAKPSAQAQDDALAAALWERSAELVRL
jgi:NAD(P)-dependent dehydrogenase (short-subunit alcohol dehydrogenase family)